MGAGDFLKHAWGATASAVERGLKAASAAAGEVEDAAVATGKAILTGARAVAVLAQVPVYGEAQVAALVFAKIPQMFSLDAIESAISPCPLSSQQQLANSLARDEDLLGRVPAKMSNDPSVIALRNAANAKAQALMSDDVYKSNASGYPNPPYTQIPGYQRLTRGQIDALFGSGASAAFDTATPNFHAALYVSNPPPPPHYTLAFRGTDPKNTGDILTDVNNALGLKTDAYNSAINLATKVDRVIARIPNATMEVTGHSLGGGLAQAASAMTGAKGNIFNAAGYNPDVFPQTRGATTRQSLTDYTVAGEPLTTFQKSVAGVPEAGARQVTIPGPLSADLLGLHSMSSVESGMMGTAKGPEADVSKLVNGP